MTKRAFLSLFCAIVGSCGASAQSQAVSPEDLLLGRIRAHMAGILHHAPNYTCLETMERTQRLGPARQFSMKDTLRLEVALVDGKEMFAWPGSKKFESDDLRTLISTGSFGNGSFALFAQAVFLSGLPTFAYRGEEMIKNRKVTRFDFHVSRLVSGYKITVREKEGIAGYHGSFWADPASLDLARLEVIAEEIPKELGVAEASDRIDYARVRIGEEDFLLPSESELQMTESGGNQNLNYVRFTGCKQYTGESVLRFDEDLSGQPDAKPPDEEIILPDGLDLSLTLAEDIDTDTAAAGDAVHATLTNDLKRKGKRIAAKGAVLLGRITRLERFPDFTVIGMTFTDLYSDGKHAGVTLEFDRLAMGALSTNALWTPTQGRAVPFLTAAPHEGLFRLKSGHAVFRRGILMYWRT